MCSRDSDHARARGPSGLQAPLGILENDAVFGQDVQQPSGEEINLGVGLWSLDLVAVDDDPKVLSQVGLFEHELDVGRLPIGRQGDRAALYRSKNSRIPGTSLRSSWLRIISRYSISLAAP